MTDRPIIFSAVDRFMSLVIPEPNSGCWIFLGDLNARGYGRYGRGQRPAHQVSLDLHGRPRPAGLEPDHKCRVRCCVNPAHLEYVTHLENLLRGRTIIAAAVAKTHCPAGHPLSGINLEVRRGKRSCRDCHRNRQFAAYRPATPRRRRQHLTRAEADRIRDLIRDKRSHRSIAAALNVSVATVSNVRNGRLGYGRPTSDL